MYYSVGLSRRCMIRFVSASDADEKPSRKEAALVGGVRSNHLCSEERKNPLTRYVVSSLSRDGTCSMERERSTIGCI
jgi:hypothetical protein